MKKYKKWILLILGIVIAASVSVYAWKEYQKQTGEEWFQKQEQYVDDLETYSSSMDDILTLYLTGSIPKEDFLTHVSIQKQELEIMERVYEQERQKHPVKTGTHTYETKAGCEAVEGCYRVMDELIGVMEQNADDSEALAYKYLAGQKQMVKEISRYMAAKEIIMEEAHE